MRDSEIEELSNRMLVTLTQIQIVNELLNGVISKDNFDLYLEQFNSDLDDLYKTHSILLDKLELYLKKEKEENLPINMGYRVLYKELKRGI